MCGLEVESPVIDVAFTTDCSSMAVLHRVGVSLFALEAKGPRLSSPRLVSTAVFDKTGPQLYDEPLLQVAFSSLSEIQVLHMADDLELLRYDFGATGQEPNRWLKTDASSVATISSPDSVLVDGVVAQHTSGRLSAVSAGEHSPLPAQFPNFLPWASFITCEEKFLAFGLSRNGHLYANSRQLAKNCTSFLVTDSHLVFTTSNHLVKFVHLTAGGRCHCLGVMDCWASSNRRRPRCPAR